MILARVNRVAALLGLSGAAAFAPVRVCDAQSTASYAQTGDQLLVRGWPVSSFGGPITVVVDASGNVTLPQIGVVGVARIPISEIRDTLTARYAKYIREPQIDPTVLRRVVINGAVLRPDVYYMDPSSRVREVIARAGGVSEVGARKKVSIIRRGATTAIPGWESDTTATSLLQSGDQIIVGRRSWLEINIIPVASLGLATASFLLSLRR